MQQKESQLIHFKNPHSFTAIIQVSLYQLAPPVKKWRIFFDAFRLRKDAVVLHNSVIYTVSVTNSLSQHNITTVYDTDAADL